MRDSTETKHETERTTVDIGDSSLTDIKKYNGIYGDRILRTYRLKVRVASPQEEMTEYMKFSDELAKLRAEGKLAIDREDPTTFHCFMIQYPKVNIDGSYLIVKCYTVLLDRPI